MRINSFRLPFFYDHRKKLNSSNANNENMKTIKELKALVKPGDSDHLDSIACALSFNPAWSEQIEVLQRFIKIAWELEHDETT